MNPNYTHKLYLYRCDDKSMVTWVRQIVYQIIMRQTYRDDEYSTIYVATGVYTLTRKRIH